MNNLLTKGQIEGPKSEIDFVFLVTNDNQNLSLDISDSDWGYHETILNSLVGTLVKYSNHGIVEPYLAESFSVSSDRLTWTYKFKNNLFCDDGTPINAKTYIEALHRQLRLYSEETIPIDFELLRGYEDFHNKKTDKIDGIKSVGNSVVFHFKQQPHDLTESLVMPYFGFWAEGNIGKNSWKNTGKFISSGPYKLSNTSTKNKIVVEKRLDWFSISADSPSKINFFYSNISNFEKKSGFNKIFVIETTLDINFTETVFKNHSIVHAPPTMISTLVLSPFKNSDFQDINLRRYFLSKLRIHQTKTALNSLFLYLSAKSEIVEVKNDFIPNKKYHFTVGHFGTKLNKSPSCKALESLLNETFKDDGFEFEFVGNESNDPNWIKRMYSNKDFDIRYSGVAAGAVPRNFVNKMMFCSTLGVSYPDPSGRLCNLISESEKQIEPISSEYIKSFNQILYEDASVIPLEHYGTVWILSRHMDEANFPATISMPLFETLRLK